MTKSVTFGPSCEGAASEHSITEPECLWYSKEELKRIKKEAKSRVAKSSSDDDGGPEDDVCLRGLEPYQEDPKNRSNRLRHFVLSLLSVQAEMQEMSLHDPKGLQAFASAHSQRDCRAARRRGKEDAKLVAQSMGDDSSKEGSKNQVSAASRGLEAKEKISIGAMCA